MGFSADGSRVLTHCLRPGAPTRVTEEPEEPPSTLRIWDTVAGTTLTIPDWKPVGNRFPWEKGQIVFTYAKGGAIQGWDTATGRLACPPLEHPRPTNGASSCLDGSRLITVINGTPARGSRVRPPRQDEPQMPEHDEARIWDLTTGKAILLPASGSLVSNRAGSGLSSKVQVRPDGRQVALIDGEGVAHVWDAVTGEKVFSHSRREQRCSSCSFSADGRRLLCLFGTVRTGGPGGFGPSGGFAGGTFDPSFRSLGSILTVQVLDTATGQPVGVAFELSGPSSLTSWRPLASPDGSRVLAPNRDGFPELWDVAAGQQIGSTLTQAAKVDQVFFSPDGQFVLTVSADNAARVWDARTGKPTTAVLKHGNPVSQAAFSPDGSQVLTVSGGTARLWPLAPVAPRQMTLPAETPSRQVYLSADGRRVLTVTPTVAAGNPARPGYSVQVLDAATGQPITREPLTATPEEADEEPVAGAGRRTFRVDFSADGRRVLGWFGRSSSPGGFAESELPGKYLCRLWDVESETVRTLNVGANGAGLRAFFSADGRYVCTTLRFPRPVPGGQARPPLSTEAESRLWDAVTGAPFPAVKYRVSTRSAGPGGTVPPSERRGPAQPPVDGGGFRGTSVVEGIAWGPDGTRLVTTEELEGGSQAHIWDMRTGKEATPPVRLDSTDPISGLSSSADGRRLLTITGNISSTKPRVARVWDVATGQAVSPPLQFATDGSRTSTLQVDLSPQGDRLLVVGGERLQSGSVVRILDAVTGRPATAPLPHEQAVSSVRFSPDGGRVMTLSGDAMVRLWDAATGELLRTLKQDTRISSAHFSSDSRRVITLTRIPNTTAGFIQVWDAATGLPLSAPLPSSEAARSFASPEITSGSRITESRDADRLLLRGAREVTVYDLSPDDRVVEDLCTLVEALSGRHVNASGGIQALEAERFEQAWKGARERFAGDWGPAPLEGLAWHRQQASGRITTFAGGTREDRRAVRTVSTATTFSQLWHLERLTAAEKDNMEHLALRGQAYLQRGELSKAVADLSRAIDEGKMEPLKSFRGEAYARLGRWKEAEADLSWKRPESPPTSSLISLALVRLQLGDLPGYYKARAEYEENYRASYRSFTGRADATAPAFLTSPLGSAFLLAPLTADDVKQYRADVDADPDREFARGLARYGFDVSGALEYRLDRSEEAEKLLKAHVEKSPSAGAGDWFFLAMVQAKAGRPKEAAQSLAQGIKLQSEPLGDEDDESFAPSVAAQWQRRLAEQILRREAEQRVKEAQKTTP